MSDTKITVNGHDLDEFVQGEVERVIEESVENHVEDEVRNLDLITQDDADDRYACEDHEHDEVGELTERVAKLEASLRATDDVAEKGGQERDHELCDLAARVQKLERCAEPGLEKTINAQAERIVGLEARMKQAQQKLDYLNQHAALASWVRAQMESHGERLEDLESDAKLCDSSVERCVRKVLADVVGQLFGK